MTEVQILLAGLKPCDEASETGKAEWLGAITVDEWSKDVPSERITTDSGGFSFTYRISPPGTPPYTPPEPPPLPVPGVFLLYRANSLSKIFFWNFSK